MKKLKKFFIIIFIIAIIVIFLVNLVKSKLGALESVESSYMDDVLETYVVKRGNIESTVKAIGQITSFNIETLSFEVDERIVEILVAEGQKVEKNQEVMKVTNGNKTRAIKTNISGLFFVVETEQETKYCIYNLDDVGVKLLLPERDIASIQLGQEAKININALKKEFTGKVDYISSLPQNDRYVVKVKIDYSDDMKFGYTAMSTIFTSRKENVISIPYDYLNMTDAGKYYVYKEEVKDEYIKTYYNSGSGNEDIKTYIEVGNITSSDVEVLSGLEENDKIIVMKW